MSNTESDKIVLETAITAPPPESPEEQTVHTEEKEQDTDASEPEAEPEPEIVSEEILKWREYIETTKGPEGNEQCSSPKGKEAFSD